jgi:hypothetical protein
MKEREKKKLKGCGMRHVLGVNSASRLLSSLNVRDEKKNFELWGVKQ